MAGMQAIKNSDLLIPFQRGDEVVIPAGTEVQTIELSRPSYVTKRRQTVRIHDACDGALQRISHMSRKDRSYHPECAADFARHDQLRLDADTNPDAAEAARLKREADEMFVYLVPPRITWAGSGGCWRYASIGDILEANGRKIKDVATGSTS